MKLLRIVGALLIACLLGAGCGHDSSAGDQAAATPLAGGTTIPAPPSTPTPTCASPSFLRDWSPLVVDGKREDLFALHVVTTGGSEEMIAAVTAVITEIESQGRSFGENGFREIGPLNCATGVVAVGVVAHDPSADLARLHQIFTQIAGVTGFSPTTALALGVE